MLSRRQIDKTQLVRPITVVTALIPPSLIPLIVIHRQKQALEVESFFYVDIKRRSS